MKAMDDQTLDLLCPGCGYNLRGISSPRCPECGIELDWAKLAQSRIPWEHRRELGRVRAFFKTVWMVISRPGELGREVARPVGYRDAQKFRWIVVVCACVPLWAWVLAGQIVWGDKLPGTPSIRPNLLLTTPLNATLLDWAICLYAGLTIWPIPWIGILLCIAAISGVAGYLFHPRSIPTTRQDRAIALSLYASAPLSLMLIPSVLFAGLIMAHRLGFIDDSRQLSLGVGAMLVTAWTSLAMVPVLFGYTTLRTLYVSTNQSWLRVLIAAAVIPVLCAGLVSAALGLLPMAVGFLRMMANSYWL